MDIVTSLGIVYGALFVAVGITALRSQMQMIYDDLLSNRGLMWITGIVVLLTGLVSLLLYREWSGGLGTLVTLFGWLTLLKGIAILLVPSFAISFYRSVASRPLFRIAGVIAIALGLWCFYLVM